MSDFIVNCYPWEVNLFLKKEWRSGSEIAGRIEEGEAVFGMQYMIYIYILKSQSLKFNLFIQILILFSILVILIMNTLIIDSAVIVHVLSFF